MRALLALTRTTARLAARLRSRATLLRVVAGAVALGLGLWGWMLRAPPADWTGVVNNLFRTLQLITLQFPTQFDGAIPWQLQVARLAVPVVALVASFHVLLGAATRPARLALLPHARGHIIVCGAEQLTHSALLTLAGRGVQVVTVGPALEPARRETLEGLGLTLVEGDPRAPATFAALNLRRASAVFLTGEDDVANLNLAMLAMEAGKGRPADLPPLVLAVLVDREELAGELDAALDGLSRQAGLRYHRLCPDREGLRLELARLAPVFRKPDPQARSHILVLGLAGRWEQALSQIILAAQDHPTERPLLSLVLAPMEIEALAAWRAMRPQLDLVAEFALLPCGALPLPPAEVAEAWTAAHPAPQLAVVLREDAAAILTALALRRPGGALGLGTAPILVRQSREDLLLSRLAQAPLGHGRLHDIVAFGGLLRAESIARVLDRDGEAMAIALHAAYQETTRGLPPGSPESIAAWDALAENLRDANRAAADHVPILLAAMGLSAGGGPPHVLTAGEIERMARIEHRRWMADRIERGWRHAPQRDNALRLHPSLLPYDALSAAEQEKDRAQIRAIAALLERRGMPVSTPMTD